jgi:chromate transporter
MPEPARHATPPPLLEIVREWGRIGCIGFGGPPAHVALLRELCVVRRGWLSESQFERAIAATNLLPGPASTQLAIYCAWRLRGGFGAAIGGLSFIVPGLIAIIALSALFLAGSPPSWIRGAGMGAGSAVAVVAVRAGLSVARPIWRRASADQRPRISLYALAGGIAAALVGPWLVLVLLGCGAVELLVRRRGVRGPRARRGPSAGLHAWPLLASAAGVDVGGTLALV